VRAPGRRPRVVFGFKVTGGKIVEIDLIADSPRLRQLDLDVLDCWAKLGHSSPADRLKLRVRSPLYLPCRSYDQLGEPLARTLPKA
jgi:hypothetical protein